MTLGLGRGIDDLLVEDLLASKMDLLRLQRRDFGGVPESVFYEVYVAHPLGLRRGGL